MKMEQKSKHFANSSLRLKITLCKLFAKCLLFSFDFHTSAEYILQLCAEYILQSKLQSVCKQKEYIPQRLYFCMGKFQSSTCKTAGEKLQTKLCPQTDGRTDRLTDG